MDVTARPIRRGRNTEAPKKEGPLMNNCKQHLPEHQGNHVALVALDLVADGPEIGSPSLFVNVARSLFPKRRKPRRSPDGQLTPGDAAVYLGVSPKTLRRLPVPFIIVGSGSVKTRRMYHRADLDHFIDKHREEAKPCQSTNAKTRRTTTTISKCEVVAFTALQDARAAAKPKR